MGVVSELGEEDVKAFVIPGPSCLLDPAALVTWCQDKMATYKIPRYVEVVSEFPRSVTKREVERHKLRDMPNNNAWDAEKVSGLASNDSQIWANALLQILYQIRCNTFHGRKSFQTQQKRILVPSIKALETLNDMLMDRIAGNGVY